MAKLGDERAQVKQVLGEHYQRANKGYSAKNYDKNSFKSDPQKNTVCFDFQPCLPTPQTGVAFYKQAFCSLWLNH